MYNFVYYAIYDHKSQAICMTLNYDEGFLLRLVFVGASFCCVHCTPVHWLHLYTDYTCTLTTTVRYTDYTWGTTTVKTTGSGRIWVMWFNDNHFLLRKLQSVCPLSVSWCHVVANIVKVELLICTFKAFNWPQRTKYFLSRWKVDGLKPGGRD